jgi:hypothetical protein
MVRGTWFYAQSNIVDCVYRNNILKAVLTNTASNIQGCIVHTGDSSSSDAPIVYRENRLISNFCNARMGEDYYGAGCNAEFYDNTFVKEGPTRADYRTIGVGYGSLASTGHKFYDSLFEGGAGYSSYRFDGTGSRDFSVGWTLTVETEPLADITIKNSSSTVVYTGAANGSGIAKALVLQYKRTPSGLTNYTPHTVTASKGGATNTVSVTVDAKKTVQVPLLVNYTLTVNSGTGSGSYAAGTVVPIAANVAPSGKAFDKWTGDTAGIANVNAASTTITMPGANATITATYKDVLHALTVNSGTGSGLYEPGTVVRVVANAAPTGKQFDKWVGDTAGVADVNAASTTLTMPDGNAQITATYKDVFYTLAVSSGTGSGSYTAGTVVPITANAAPSGKVFYKWTGDTAGVANVNAASTTLTMPAANAAVTATYKFRGDLNGDGFVGQMDLDIVLSMWGKSGAEITDRRADVDGNDFVGQGDLDYVLSDWGKGTIP